MYKTFLLLSIQGFSLVCMAQPGTLDPTFGTGGVVKIDLNGDDDVFTAMSVQGDGKIIAAGYHGTGSNQDVLLARLNPDGAIDSTFSSDGLVLANLGSNDFAYAITLQSDGKILVAGARGGSTNQFALLRYLENGVLDNTFGAGGKVFNSFPGSTGSKAYAVQVQDDGNILIAGATFIGSGEDYAIARYQPNGILDSTFSGDGRFALDIGGGYDQITAIAIQDDGKILCTGPAAGSNKDIVVVRLLQDGTPDSTFGISGIRKTDVNGGHDTGRSMLLLPDQKILVGGAAFNGINFDFALIRLHPDGNPDLTFGTAGKVTTSFGNLSNSLQSMTLQPDGKIVVAGYYQQQLSFLFAIVRYHPNGNPDNTFGSSGIASTDIAFGNDAAYAVALQPDGKIIVGGHNSFALSMYDFVLTRYFSGLPTGTVQTESGMPGISLYPNPLHTRGLLQFDLHRPDALSAAIADSRGVIQRVLLTDKEMAPGVHTVPVDMSDLPSGFYSIVIRGRYGVTAIKVVR